MKKGLTYKGVIIYVVAMGCLLGFLIYAAIISTTEDTYNRSNSSGNSSNNYTYNYEESSDSDPKYGGNVKGLGLVVDVDNNSDIINIPSDSFPSKRFLSQRVYYASLNNPNAKIYVTNEISEANFDYSDTVSNYDDMIISTAYNYDENESFHDNAYYEVRNVKELSVPDKRLFKTVDAEPDRVISLDPVQLNREPSFSSGSSPDLLYGFDSLFGFIFEKIFLSLDLKPEYNEQNFTIPKTHDGKRVKECTVDIYVEYVAVQYDLYRKDVEGDWYYTVRNIKDIDNGSDDGSESVTGYPGDKLEVPSYGSSFTVPATNEGKKVKSCTMHVRPMYGYQQLDLYRKESENSEWENVGTYSVDPSPNAYETSYTFTYEE